MTRRMYERLLHQPEGTFDLGRAGKHMEQAQSPRMLGGDNFIGLPNLIRPASAGAMVGITHLLPKCNLLAVEHKELSWVSASHRGHFISSMKASNSGQRPILNY